ncbi:YfiT family bacillithiol transferase [Chitinophaga nivalis]|uniref:Metal-dependent hydrolase n=1 Tax=Chitinophaga nivalis TaxID=2991709 RepID=A0ABT3IHM1_9BACT|nr:putative metal-dependent hydrolase [Chitinophaga nivalis]MCW3466844.1 putative metal-dependent hydrolase [Chitinophaga nivalis]MCW3483465.1 putative metal-dependent hydrolase [Chitinophaga nivalis]
MDALQYPIGPFEAQADYTPAAIAGFIADIRFLPTLIEIAVQQLDAYQLDTPYRPGGWTVAQVVHHLADSHINAITRMKLALTEDNPVIKPYDQDGWVGLPDVMHTPVNVSVTLLHALHTRWADLMERLTDAQWERTFVHPEGRKVFNLKTQAANYAWHGKHHLQHILRLKERMEW